MGEPRHAFTLVQHHILFYFTHACQARATSTRAGPNAGLLTSASDTDGPVCGRRKTSLTQTFTSDDGFSQRCGDLLASHVLSALHLSTENDTQEWFVSSFGKRAPTIPNRIAKNGIEIRRVVRRITEAPRIKTN